MTEMSERTRLELAAGQKAADRFRRQEQLDEIARRFAKATPGSNITWSTYYGDETIFVNHMTVVVRKFGGEEFTLDGGPIGEFPSEQLVAQLCLL
jgi:hypothetical protein